VLKHTFLHLPGIGPVRERQLWQLGVLDWDRAATGLPGGVPARYRRRIPAVIEASHRALQRQDSRFFARRLAAGYHWRLYAAFRDAVAFLDIETTGLSSAQDRITTIALYDGKQVHTFVRGRNLEEFPRHIGRYKLLVTYNGRCFDVPFLERQFAGLRLDQPHIDLRHLLRWLGYGGGLKHCERQLGLVRAPELDQMDGFLAVRLWWAHERGDRRALPLLLRYNVEDAINLQRLMDTAYNMAVARLPITVEHVPVAQPPQVDLPFDPAILYDLMGTIS